MFKKDRTQKFIYVVLSLLLFWIFSLGCGIDLWNDDGLGGSFGSQSTSQEFASLKQLQEVVPTTFTPQSFINSLDVTTAKRIGNYGAGETIAFVEYGDHFDQSAFQVFNKTFNLPQIKPIVLSHGKPIKPSIGNNDTEILLDTEWAHVIAPKARELILDMGTNTIHEISNEFNHYAVSAVSVTSSNANWGMTERNPLFYILLRIAGISDWKIVWIASHYPTFVSSGDSGSDINPSALIPQTVMVGGIQANVFDGKSKLKDLKSYQIWGSEGSGIEWSDLGGFHYPGFWRRIPDVTWLAGYPGVVIRDKNGWYPTYGTSIAGPLWAALWALGDADHMKLQHTHIGINANAVLYALNTEHPDSFVNNSIKTKTPSYLWGLGFPNPPTLVQNLGHFNNDHAFTYNSFNFAQVPFWVGTFILVVLFVAGFAYEHKNKKLQGQNPFIARTAVFIPHFLRSTIILLAISLIVTWMSQLIPVRQFVAYNQWIPARTIAFLLLSIVSVWITFLFEKNTLWPSKSTK